MPVEMFARCATDASVVPGRPASSMERSVASINWARRISRIPSLGIGEPSLSTAGGEVRRIAVFY
ncbi:hypothetical protein Y047_4722 [Burkholderia pseudomallei MSHR3016]|uniref:hypothetical protein n=1 Tax=Burkholderia mallei TaxID=13373 RepID=UPI0002F9D98E|nr:hypothetical protein [Burkholderia mallei]KGW35115.1 hypothetical protein Y047_4722 [Burkholderia pseudomallei MSHR3016]